jgi:hypothetical protein
MKNVYLYFSAGILCASLAAPPAHAALSAEKILRLSDAVRLPNGDFKVDAKVISTKPNQTDVAAYEALMKGKDRTLIKTFSPATERGTSVLMVQRDLWVFLPAVSKPIRISLQQRLVGEVSNGDLARMNFVGDYTPKIVESKPAFYRLDLVAKSDDITYGRIQLWVAKKTFRPLQAAFYAASGRLLKVGTYEDYRMLAGAMRPGRLVLKNAVEKDRVSTIYYTDMENEGTLPEKYFTRDYLKKFKY